MPRLVSLNSKIQQLAGLVDTKGVPERDGKFIADMVEKTGGGKVVSNLSEKQTEWLEDLWDRHFA